MSDDEYLADLFDADSFSVYEQNKTRLLNAMALVAIYGQPGVLLDMWQQEVLGDAMRHVQHHGTKVMQRAVAIMAEEAQK